MTELAERTHTIGTAGLIGLLALAGAFVGFILQLLVAYFFGASAHTDAYFMALSTSELLGKLLLGGSITAVFLPLFIDRLVQQEREQAWRLALNLFHILTALLAVVLLGLAFFTSAFVAFVAPGFDASTQTLTVTLIRFMLPAFLLYFLIDMATAMLQALRQFSIPAMLRLVAPLASIICVVGLARTYGIYALAVGTLLSAAVQLGLLAWGLHREGFRYYFVLTPSDPAVRRIFHLVYPFLFSVLATQSAGIVYRILVSDLSVGSLSALKYAEKITQLLTIIFLNSVTTVIYPLLSEKASRQDLAGVRDTVSSALRLTTFLTVPIIVGVVGLRESLIALIYLRGSFTVQDALLTSSALLFLIVGLTTNAASSVLGHATLALQKSRAAVAVTVISQSVAVILFILLVPRLEVAGLALASSLVPLSSALLYYLYLSRYLTDLQRIFYHTTFLKIAVLAVGLGLTLWGWRALEVATLSSHPGVVFLSLLGGTLLGGAVYFGGAYLWRVPEVLELLALGRNRLLKVRGVL